MKPVACCLVGFDTRAMMTESEHESYRSTLEAKLQPARIRSTLGFAGLYQITHELIKESVIDELRNFYFAGIDETGILVDEPRYAAEVLTEPIR
jgi:hypothetical protein